MKAIALVLSFILAAGCGGAEKKPEKPDPAAAKPAPTWSDVGAGSVLEWDVEMLTDDGEASRSVERWTVDRRDDKEVTISVETTTATGSEKRSMKLPLAWAPPPDSKPTPGSIENGHSEKVGSETISVPAGSFSCDEWLTRVSGLEYSAETHAWKSDGAPWPVKTVSRTAAKRTIELTTVLARFERK